MKKLCLLFSLCPVFLWGQVKIDFENGLPGSTLQFPAGRWEVSSENPLKDEFSLRHSFDNSISERDVISFSLEEPEMDSMVDISFMIDYDYNPSGSNNWSVYFLSEGNANRIKSEAKFQALMLGVNQLSTNDSLCLYHYNDGDIRLLLNCGFNCETMMEKLPWKFHIVIKNHFFLFVGAAPLQEDYDTLVFLDGFNIPEMHPGYFGISYSYTSSKDMLLGVDEILLNYSVKIDSLVPVLQKSEIHAPGLIKFRFDEDIFTDQALAIDINFKMDSVWSDENEFYIKLEGNPENNYQLNYRLSGISDRKGNSGVFEGSLMYYYPDYHDIIFTEIMPDPSPPVYLPENEYLEIYNRSGHSINLYNWKLITGNRTWVLPEKTINAGEYLVFSEGMDLSFFSDSMNCVPLFTSSSVLSNSGQQLLLYNAHEMLIDALEYSESWYGGDFVAEGGWSLERTDLENLCGGGEIWKPSKHRYGGTPGKQNSVKVPVIDNRSPYIQYVVYIDSNEFIFKFNEVLDKDLLKTGREHLYEKNKNIDSINLLPPFFRECRLKLKTAGMETVIFQNIWKDCEGNTRKEIDSITCTTPEDPFFTSVILSEVLYAPLPGCPEFIELYNVSGNVLSLRDFQIGTGEINDISPGGTHISQDEILFYPGNYLVLTRDPNGLRNFYDIPENAFILKFQNMPPLPDKGARITLSDRGNTLIDEFSYSENSHFPLINDVHGVSLERLVLNREAGMNSAWHSASSLSGFATPGYKNSQFHNPDETREMLYIDEEIFTPNNDGDKDLAVIRIGMEKEGYMAMIRIFDSEGRLVKWLGNNILLGTDDVICWDGRDETGRICPSGIYVVHMEAYHLSGSRKIYKEVVVLGR